MNKVVLSGKMKEMPRIQMNKSMMVALFNIDDGTDLHECFAVGEPVKILLKLNKDELEDVAVEGVLHNYHYKDTFHTPHKVKYILVYNFETKNGETRFECKENEKEMIDYLHHQFIEQGLHPVPITNNYV